MKTKYDLAVEATHRLHRAERLVISCDDEEDLPKINIFGVAKEDLTWFSNAVAEAINCDPAVKNALHEFVAARARSDHAKAIEAARDEAEAILGNLKQPVEVPTDGPDSDTPDWMNR